MAQPSLGINIIELGRPDQGVDRGGALATAVGAGEQVVAAAADRHAAQRAFGRRVVDLDSAVVAVAQQCWPEFERVQDCRRRVGLARQRLERGAQPSLQVVDQGKRAGLPNLSSVIVG